jgi:hypothetical protein
VSRYQLNQDRLQRKAPEAIVMHPGPMIRGLEITSDVADGPQSAIAEQVGHGVPIRMALIYRALREESGRHFQAQATLSVSLTGQDKNASQTAKPRAVKTSGKAPLEKTSLTGKTPRKAQGTKAPRKGGKP